LSGLKDALGLKTNDKPFFPYLFNCKKNKDAVLDTLPPIEDYSPDSKKPEDREKLLTWYAANKNTRFCLKEALYEYGENDTQILLEAIVKFREIIKEICNGADLMIKSMTIAGLAMNIFKFQFMEKDQLAIVPEFGYEREDNASDTAIKWLEWMQKQEGIEIKHAANGGERKIFYRDSKNERKHYKPDGYCIANNTVYEFNGCYFHGCLECMSRDTLCVNKKTADENYNATQERKHHLRRMGFKVVTKWECQLAEELKANSEMKAFFSDLNVKGRIDPRDAFSGGITHAFKMMAQADDTHEISHYDVVSLYPFVNYSKRYPVGMPKIIVPKETHVNWTSPNDICLDGQSIEGLVKVRVLPPRGLYIPVLPTKIPDEKRLLFLLCHKCARKFIKVCNNKCHDEYNCPHTDEERKYTITTTTIELKEALRRGYTVDRLYRIWHYEEWSDTVFAEYVKTFIKIKVENSKFPSSVQTDKEKKEFSDLYFNSYGIEIDLEKVGLNPGMRFIAKILLNSLWGKFAQRNILGKTEIFTSTPASRAKFLRLFTDDRIIVNQILPMTQDVIRTVHTLKAAYVEEGRNSNIVIALYTTAHARLVLLECLQEVQEDPECEILYCDTDSIMVRHPRGKPPIDKGQLLGEMEQEDPDYDILEFVAAGPKQWAKRMRHKQTGNIRDIVKIRGMYFILFRIGTDTD
jgi:G:T-mismatch repair DNA endonuclease (very short patch repair protein)